MLTIKELNHVAIHVADVARSVKFYGEVLGLPALPRPAFTFPGAWFALGSQELHIIGDRRDQPVYSHNRGNHFAMLVDDIEAAVAVLDDKQIEHSGLKVRPDGALQVFFQDPDGFYLELTQVD